jgi:glycosyltransferase involved in cell wall biosynthesis
VDDVVKRSLVVVPAWVGQQSCAEIEREVAAGERPRSDYVELARALDADVMDMQFMEERATRLGRTIRRRAGIWPGQVAEAFARRRQYADIVVRSDWHGLLLAALFKLARSRRDLVLISHRLSPLKKAVLVRHLRAHTHMKAIVNYSSVQMRIAAGRLGVPGSKLHHALQPVDERFWRPLDGPTENLVCSVGYEERDYATLVKALQGLHLQAELAVGSTVLRPAGDASTEFAPLVGEIVGEGPPPGVRVRRQIGYPELRRLYARSRFVVVPLKDVDVDAGVTAICEAMAMGKAVVVSRTRGQVDVIRDGVHGIYVPPGDPRALRAALEHLQRHPEEATRMGRAGRSLVEARHTLDAWVAQVADVVRGRDRARGRVRP